MSRVKPLVLIMSLIGLWFVWLTFTKHWMFIIGAVVVIFLNQKELQKK